jgi:hypothetical protein
VPSLGVQGRRSDRVLRKVAIAVWCDGAGPMRAHTVVVNGHGALILAPQPFRAEALLRVVNQESGRTALCRVAWSGGEDLPGLYKIGIEILGEGAGFWGDVDGPAAAPSATTPEPQAS